MAGVDDDGLNSTHLPTPPVVVAPAGDNGFSLVAVLCLHNINIRLFWQLWFGILLWMAVSYVVVHVIALCCGVVMLRRHPWMPFLVAPFIAMLFVGPVIFGAVTSASIAWTVALANKSITSWHCMILGCGQTAVVVLLSYSRILATM